MSTLFSGIETTATIILSLHPERKEGEDAHLETDASVVDSSFYGWWGFPAIMYDIILRLSLQPNSDDTSSRKTSTSPAASLDLMDLTMLDFYMGKLVGVFFNIAIKLLALIYSLVAAWILSFAESHPYQAKLWHAWAQ